MKKDIKIIAVASDGGHWVELLRLMPVFEKYDTYFISTKDSNFEVVKDFSYFNLMDFNRNNILYMVKQFFEVIKILKKVKPEAIITTGAAPGLLVVIAGKMLGVRSLWIDSIANAETISLSGRIARRFSDKTFTQWASLDNKRFLYKGNILS